MEVPAPNVDNAWLLPAYQPDPDSEYAGGLPPRAKLCDACSMVTSEAQCRIAEPSDEFRPFPAPWGTIRRNAADRKCGICYIVDQNIEPAFKDGRADHVDVSFNWTDLRIGGMLILYFTIAFEEKVPVRIYFYPLDGTRLPIHEEAPPAPKAVPLN